MYTLSDPCLPFSGDSDSVEDEDVDILTKEKLYAFSSDEEDEKLTGDEAPVYYLPAVSMSASITILSLRHEYCRDAIVWPCV